MPDNPPAGTRLKHLRRDLDPPPSDGIQREPRCPTCLTPQRAMPRSKVPCWKCGVVLYPRSLNGEKVLCNDEGLEELNAMRRWQENPPPVPCIVCGCSIDPWWKLCCYCEQAQDINHGLGALSRLTPHQLTKVMERQLLESMPELVEEALEALEPVERLLWFRYWSTPFPRGISLVITFKCACGRALKGSRCLECGDRGAGE